jgi:hypothetical protein
MDKESGIRKRNTKRNIREKIRRGGHKQKDNEDGKSEGIILKRRGFKTKKEEEFWDYVRQFEIVGLVETWEEEQSWAK